jgi:hypothetical protein
MRGKLLPIYIRKNALKNIQNPDEIITMSALKDRKAIVGTLQ